MRRSIPLFFALVLSALPLLAGEPHQSYISYETGDAVVVQQEDGRAVDARLNLPLYPGDTIRTQRHGQLEIRLSDGNVFGIDRGSELQFSSILDSYDGRSEGTVAQLRSGKVIIQRLGTDSSALRLDTAVASYVATANAVYGVETGGRGQDTVSVYDGSVEVRTATRTGRLRSGDSATVDNDGIGAVLTVSKYGLSDFEDWILHRWERSSNNSTYLDSRLSYASSDLDYYGGWVYVNSYNAWAWRPRVTVGWQPYYYGSWSYGPSGSLVWVSDEPWGWVPYHYGRWAFAGGYGWVWVPGAVYSPAWVYWAFGPSYIGWVPAGWYDCWGPYYSWAYSPYSHGYYGGYYGGYGGGHHGHGGQPGHDGSHGYGGHGGSTGNIGLGFYGKVHMGDVDLNHWTFVDPSTVVSHRTDRTSLTTDQIRDRLKRGGDSVTVAGGGVSLARDEWKDPVSAVRTISRRGIGSGTGKEGSGTTADLTPFFRRDPDLPSTVRDQVARISNGGVIPAPASTVNRGTSAGSTSGPQELGGAVRRNDGSPDLGGLSRIPRTNAPATGQIARPTGDAGGTSTTPRSTPETPRITPRQSDGGGVVQRPTGGDAGTATDSWRSPGGNRTSVPRDSSGSDSRRNTTRDRETTTRTVVPRSRTIDRGGDAQNSSDTPSQTVPRTEAWRSRGGNDDGNRVNRTTEPRSTGTERSIDIPRRIIDQIGGARVVPSGGSSDRGSMNRDRGSSSSSPRPSSVDRPSSSPPPRSSSPAPSSAPSSPPPSTSSHSGEASGRVKIK